ncbi:MAG: hypothetical protein LIO94_07115 [Clostridiales bacterium]|nr:hypothetical protein [Clostridiales bacterium]
MNVDNNFEAASQNDRKDTIKKGAVKKDAIKNGSVGRTRTLCIAGFFGRLCLQMMGIVLLVAVFWDLLVPVAKGEAGGDWPLLGGMAGVFLEDLPPYLLLAGGVTVWICPTFFFNNYITTMISMNATRRLTALSMWFCEGVVILVVIGIVRLFSVFGMGTFWVEWLPLIFAAEIFAALIGIIFGMVSVRYRTLGIICNVVCAGSFAFLCGLIAGLEGETSIFNQNTLEWVHSPVLPVIGFALYAAAGAVSLRGLRKMEVRR